MFPIQGGIDSNWFLGCQDGCCKGWRIHATHKQVVSQAGRGMSWHFVPSKSLSGSMTLYRGGQFVFWTINWALFFELWALFFGLWALLFGLCERDHFRWNFLKEKTLGTITVPVLSFAHTPMHLASDADDYLYPRDFWTLWTLLNFHLMSSGWKLGASSSHCTISTPLPLELPFLFFTHFLLVHQILKLPLPKFTLPSSNIRACQWHKAHTHRNQATGA